MHYFPKSSISQFLIEKDEIKTGDKILIKGATTGEQKMIVETIYVNEIVAEKAISGEQFTIKTHFRIRASDKLYKIID